MKLEKVTIIGAGTMGRGIAQWFAQQNIETYLADNIEEMSAKSLELVHQSWDKLQVKSKFSSSQVANFKSLLKVTSMADIPKDSDLIIEAIIEDLKIKTELFTALDKEMNEETIFASNTSSIPISSMAKALSDSRKTRFCGLHFFNPAPIMKLVEIIKGHATEQALIVNLQNWFKNAGKEPALCNDSPGFIVNRVARNFYGESLRIVEHYDPEKIAEVDSVLKACGGFKMGPFELMDLIGIDINYAVTESVWKSFYREPRFAPHRLQKEMLDSGRLGKKVNEGFYSYEK